MQEHAFTYRFLLERKPAQAACALLRRYQRKSTFAENMTIEINNITNVII